MELYPMPYVVFTDEAVRVAAETVHMAVATGYAAVAHNDGYLVQCLGEQCPEVPVVVGTPKVGLRVAFNGVVQIGELHRVAEEKYRRIVANQIPYPFVGIEFQRKAPDIALGIRRTALARNRREPGKHIGLFPDVAEYAGFGVLGDVVRNGKCSESTRTFCVHTPLGDDLAVKVCHFFEEPKILHEHWSPWPGRLRILVVWNRSPGLP